MAGMHKKVSWKFKTLDILAVTTQAHEGIETKTLGAKKYCFNVTTQAHEGIETYCKKFLCFDIEVTTQAHEGIET